jgi:hypothetical protein
MARIGLVIVLPLLMVNTIGALLRQDLGRLLRGFLVQLPLALLGAAVGIQLTVLGLAVTDSLCNYMTATLGSDTLQALKNLDGAIAILPLDGGAGFVAALAEILVAIGALLIWLELVMRSAAIYASVFFLPLTLCALVWPTTARWAKRLVETLAALILSKFVIVAIITLATGALAQPSGVDAVLAGAALLLLAAFAPFALLRLIPVAEAGLIGHLEGLSRRPLRIATATATGPPANFLQQHVSANFADRATSATSALSSAEGVRIPGLSPDGENDDDPSLFVHEPSSAVREERAHRSATSVTTFVEPDVHDSTGTGIERAAGASPHAPHRPPPSSPASGCAPTADPELGSDPGG